MDPFSGKDDFTFAEIKNKVKPDLIFSPEIFVYKNKKYYVVINAGRAHSRNT